VVIAASGGGSHAARWTTEVLARLRGNAQLGERFFKSTALISAVSGGALGTVYALERFTDGPPACTDFEKAREAASHSTVGALAWGLTYPDLVRKVFPWAFDVRQDRGWALERAWQSVLAEPTRVPTLEQWTNDAREGRKPALVFNATVMETGRRFLLSRVDLQSTRADQFSTLYKGRDLSIITAVRLSATFPFLAPIARPLTPVGGEDQHDPLGNTAYHLADGGYYDNSGTMTIVEFLNALPQGRTQKVIVVQIRTGLDRGSIVAADHQNWLAAIGSPVATAMNVSMSSQADRADLELQLLAERWKSAQPAVEIHSVVFRLRDTGTLPWHLSDPEKQSISEAWTAGENVEALRHLESLFTGSALPAVPHSDKCTAS
jgi:hypothetical protein